MLPPPICKACQMMEMMEGMLSWFLYVSLPSSPSPHQHFRPQLRNQGQSPQEKRKTKKEKEKKKLPPATKREPTTICGGLRGPLKG